MNETKENEFLNKTIVVVVGALICSALWGSAFPSIKIGYQFFNISPEDTGAQILFAGIRFCLAGVLAIIFGSIISKKVLIPKIQSIDKILKLSLLQTVAQYVLFYIGLAHTTGVRSSIMEGTNVFVAIAISSLLYRQEKLTIRKIIGSVVGFVGVVLISVIGSESSKGNYVIGDLCVFFSTFAYGFSSVLLKKYSKDENTVILSGYQFVFGGLIMIIVGKILGGELNVITTPGILMLIYLAFVSSVAYSLWGILLKYNPISKVAVFGFMNPVCGVILSAILLDEGSSLGVVCIFSLILVCTGIFIVNKGDK